MLYETIEVLIDDKNKRVKVIVDWTNYTDPRFEAEGSTIREAITSLVDKLEKYKAIDPNQMKLPNV